MRTTGVHIYPDTRGRTSNDARPIPPVRTYLHPTLVWSKLRTPPGFWLNATKRQCLLRPKGHGQTNCIMDLGSCLSFVAGRDLPWPEPKSSTAGSIRGTGLRQLRRKVAFVMRQPILRASQCVSGDRGERPRARSGVVECGVYYVNLAPS